MCRRPFRQLKTSGDTEKIDRAGQDSEAREAFGSRMGNRNGEIESRGQAA